MRRTITRTLLFYVLISLTVIITVADFHYARKTLLPAREANLTNGDYAFILFELDHDEVLMTKSYPSYWFTFPTDPDDPYYRCKFQQAFDSVLVIALNVNENKGAFKKFQDAVQKRSPDPPFNSPFYNQTSVSFVSPSQAYRAPVSDIIKRNVL